MTGRGHCGAFLPVPARVAEGAGGVDPDPVTRELYQRALKSETNGAAKYRRAAGCSRGCHADCGARGREWKAVARLLAVGREREVVPGGDYGRAGNWKVEARRRNCTTGATSHHGRSGRAAAGALLWRRRGNWRTHRLRSGCGQGPLRTGSSQLPQAPLEELVRVLPEVLADDPAMPAAAAVERELEQAALL